MRQLHIAFFNRSFYPDTTATGQLLTELCESLVRVHGCRVSVVAGFPLLSAEKHGNVPAKGLVLQREQYRGIEILRARGTRFSKRRFIGRFSNYVTYFLSACYAGLRLDRPDVVVALTDPPIIGLGAYLASRWFRVPLVMSYRDIFPEVARLLEDFKSQTVDRVLQRVNCFLAENADRVVALGDTMRLRLIEEKGADPAKTIIIPDWADCDEIVPGPKRNQFALAHGLLDKFVVMHSGNIGLSQGLETVVQAASYLRDYPEIQMVFVGDGIRRPVLEQQAKSLGLQNVRFLPFQPKESLKESFAAADVFVVSLKQGLAGYIVPSKLYGILAAGRPYVAAVEESCEITAITKKYNSGLLSKLGEPEDLAEKILALYRDHKLAQRLGENARRAALEFDRALQVRKYDELFHELVRIPFAVLQPRFSFLKRLFDVLLSGLGLIVSAPLWAIFSLLIRIEDRGPVFYRQERVGKHGKVFQALKFRSMIPAAEKGLGPVQAAEDDWRVTRMGRILRPTAMDELPQLWNIFRGDMSFVGPRALRSAEIEVKSPGPGAMSIKPLPNFQLRHQVRPGLTGLAQVYAPRDATRRQKLRFDLLYIKHRTFWLDFKLILISFYITFRGQWERRRKKF